MELPIKNTRKKSKLSTPRCRDTETLVSTTPLPFDVALKKPPNYKGSFKSLSEKGIKITSYDTRDGAGRPIRESEDNE